ncbi:peptidoglycan D,D-transpeptidase FtsI family protein [Piscinibacter sakaiensis]|uniref:Peptidoglycan D,D-transpeptidase FtsI n=1 Tax=Piscinibacter sakaiensis TaxID=1547922 RepID=A0A0K8P353_PISS1|nr:penicillin-binding protein 2 [Piscinibacter sakaiensis]GAP37097.1 cell division protein FtsI [Piscinibacter sakaiensis]
MSLFKRRPRAAGAVNVRAVNYSSSPLLASRTPAWRSKFLVALIGAGFVLLIGRAAYVQVIGSEFFQKQGEIRYARTLDLTASRGRILDRHGVILASSVPVPSLWAIPKDLEASAAQRRQLARLLGMTPKDLDGRLDDSPNFVWLRRQVDEALAKEVLALGIKGIYQVREYKRQYPEGEAAAHVVGFTNVEDKGQEGIELAFQHELAGRNGSRRVIKDRLGRVVEDIGDSVAPLDGRDIALSIDSKVQFFAYQRIRDAVAQHKAKAGSVVVLDARSGEVLALANFPSFNPGDRSRLTGEQLRNRALTDTFEPGSTMKPFIAGWAMESGRVTPKTVIQTAPGRITITGATISDSHPHGALTVEEVIQKSSNVGTVKMAMQMQPREMHELFSKAGFGQKPQIDFPGAVTGRLRPYKSWRPIEQATMSYGYGLSASLFQLARAYTVFAHDGEVMPISLLKKPPQEVSASEGPVSGVKVLSPQTAASVRQMLQLAAGPGGTAPLAQAMGYSVGGKTGTAHKQEGKGYSAQKYRSWFVGMAPISQPRIVVAVMVDEPSAGQYYGGLVAAPVFSEVVQQTLRSLGVPPDLEVRPQIVTRQLPAVEESF